MIETSKTWKLIAALGLGMLGSAANATVVLVGNYGLGEAGSVGAPPSYLNLQDSAGTANNFTYFQSPGGQTTAIATTGLAAPGSTAALSLDQTNTAQRNAGWAIELGNGHGLANDWIAQLWAKTPDSTGSGTSYIFFNTNMNQPASGISLEFNNGNVNLLQGTDTASRIVGFAYTPGQWFEATLLSYNGLLSLYEGASATPVASSSSLSHTLDTLGLGFGPGASAGRGASASFDELKVWSFDHTTDSLGSVLGAAGVAAVPEPGSLALLGLGGTAMLARRKKQRA